MIYRNQRSHVPTIWINFRSYLQFFIRMWGLNDKKGNYAQLLALNLRSYPHSH
jgi:hypothetical protein